VLAVTATGDDPLTRGRVALVDARWRDARAAFEAALAAGDDPDALDGLGEALWFLGEIPAGVAARERAFVEHVRRADRDGAARTAAWVADQHHEAGRDSAARGWIARAERAVGDADDSLGRGWVAIGWARQADDVGERIDHADRAIAVARAHGDAELEVLALSTLGGARVDAGDIDRGMLLLEEALAVATAAGVDDVHCIGKAYCNLLRASSAIGDWGRTVEWCAVVDDFARTRGGIPPLMGICRSTHAEVLLATGRWPEAERELERALADFHGSIPELEAPVVATLAELRLRQGRLPDAERLLTGREEHPASLRALALLHMAVGRADDAVSLLRRGLTGAGRDTIHCVWLLAPLVDALIAAGAPGQAREAHGRLVGIGVDSGSALVGALADLAAARLAMAETRPDAAAEHARRALAAFGRLGMTFDAAEARLELGRALAADVPGLAAEEVRSALTVFRATGASRAIDSAAAVLRGLGAGTAPRNRVAGELTAREHEVLELVALGMSNARIAATLVISEKTAGHHVSHILSKLGVGNRAEAAAYAARTAASGRMGNT